METDYVTGLPESRTNLRYLPIGTAKSQKVAMQMAEERITAIGNLRKTL